VNYGRRGSIAGAHTFQTKDYLTLGLHIFHNSNKLAQYQTGILYESKRFEVNHIARNADELIQLNEVKPAFDNWTNNALSFDKTLPDVGNTAARLIDWNRTYFWNDAQTDVLPLGQSGKVVLAHHEETACFNSELIHQVFNGKVTNGMLSGGDEGNYIEKDGYWWQRTAVNYFKKISGFYVLDKVETQAGIFTAYGYDDYFLSIIETTDPLGNITKGAMDYNIVEPFRLTDANDNIAEVLYDALGVAVVSTHQGTVLHNGSNHLYGNGLMDAYNRRSDEGFDTIMAQPELYLQNAATFLFYDVTNFPLRSIHISLTIMLQISFEKYPADQRKSAT
jgi:hypothetical protein